MVNEGHQIGHHTWSHQDLQTLSAADTKYQIETLNTAMTALIGGYPKYIRPPYYSYNDTTIEILASYNMYIVNSDVDTLDWQYGPLDQITTSEQIFDSEMGGGGTISLEHDFSVNTTTIL